MLKYNNWPMAIRLILTLYLWLGASLCHAAWIDLGSYADLTDKADDTAALEAALQAAGDGGIVFMPAGTVVLNRPVIVKDVSLRLYGAGMSVTTIAPDFRVDNPETAALSFMANGRATRSPVWEIGDFSFKPDRAAQGSALALIDAAGTAGKTRMTIRNVSFASGTRDYFNHGIIIDGMAEVDIEESPFVGELLDNTGEAPGRLTLSHLRLKGRRAGCVSLFRCHMRQAENVIELLAGFEEFKASYCSMVQNKHGILLSMEEEGGRLIVQSSAFQSDVYNIVKDSPPALDAVRISSTRFIVPGEETPCIRIRAAKNVRVIGNFLHSGGIQLEDVHGGVFFGNHTTEPEGAIELINCSRFQCCNDYPTGGGDNYPKIYTVSGRSSDIQMARKDEIK